MAKNRNTFEKRRKEMERKRKAEEKRERRRIRKAGGTEPEAAEAPGDPAALPAEASPDLQVPEEARPDDLNPLT